MKKITILLSFAFLIFPLSLKAKMAGLGFFGGLGWGDGIYEALKGEDYPYGINYKNPKSDTTFSGSFGATGYYFVFPAVAATFSLSMDYKRLRVLYPNGDKGKDGWQNYDAYTFKTKFTTLSLGARYYTGQEFLFEGKVFFGAGGYIGIHGNSVEITVDSVRVNKKWYATLFLFDPLDLTYKKQNEIYKEKNTSLHNDKGFFLEAGLAFPFSDGFSFDFFVKYSFGLAKVYTPQSGAPVYELVIKNYVPRTFLLSFSLNVFFNI